MLRTIDDERLSVLVVWEPIMKFDSEETARRAAGLFPDPRVRQFWAPTTEVGEMFQKPLKLKSEPAWDAYLVYAPGARWEQSPPRPRDFMHQLWALPASKRLDGKVLAAKLSKLLKR